MSTGGVLRAFCPSQTLCPVDGNPKPISSSGAPGGLAGGFFATSVGGLRPLGLEGWRFAFHVVAGISIGAGLVVLAIARDPRRKVRSRERAGACGRRCSVLTEDGLQRVNTARQQTFSEPSRSFAVADLRVQQQLCTDRGWAAAC